MDLYSWFIQNKEIFRIIYALIIALVCLLIVLRTHKIFKLSLHQGVRYFRNAFAFYGLAFVLRYLLGSTYFFTGRTTVQSDILTIAFEFLLIMAGFSLIYSLIYKKFEGRYESFSSLFNLRFIIFYCLALVVAVLDILWSTYLFMFVLQIILFIFASAIGYSNYKKDKGKHRFLKLFFLVMILNLVAWIANFAVAIFLNWLQLGVIIVSIINLVIFLAFLYSVLNTTKRKNLKYFGATKNG